MVDSDIINDTLKWVPGGIVTSTTLLGISWENWVYILTAIYTMLQIGDWVWTRVIGWREKRERTQ